MPLSSPIARLAALGLDERRLIWLRYRRRLTVREMAGRIDAHPKSLYRQFDRILLTIRRQSSPRV